MQYSAGTLVDGRYEIVSKIGVGGFGTVYEAKQAQLGRTVAIKFLHSLSLLESDALPRFEREAKAINLIKHKNIVAFYGYGVFEGTPYMVLELIKGESLQSLLSAGKPLGMRRSLDIVMQVIDGLECAHKNGIVHRDLKSTNILLTLDTNKREIVKIIDFGLAKLLPGNGQEGQKLTEAGLALGTCMYMSPEQCTGGIVDHRSDLYAIGCVLFQCLTGKVPFDVDSNVAAMYNHVNLPPPNLAEVDEVLSNQSELQGFLDTALAKEPDKRFQSAAEMKAALAHIQKELCLLPTQELPALIVPPGLRNKLKHTKPLHLVAAIAILLASSLTAIHLSKPSDNMNMVPQKTTTQHTSRDELDKLGSPSKLSAMQGLKAMNARQFSLAIRQFELAIKQNEQDKGLGWDTLTRTYGQLGECYTNFGNLAQAHATIRHALNERSKHIRPKEDEERWRNELRMGRLLTVQGQTNGAITFYRATLVSGKDKATTPDMNESGALLELAVLLNATNRPREAYELAAESLQGNPRQPFVQQLKITQGIAQRNLGHIAESEKILEEAMSASSTPASDEAVFYLAQSHYMNCDVEAAERALKKYENLSTTKNSLCAQLRIKAMRCALAVQKKHNAEINSKIRQISQDLETLTNPDEYTVRDVHQLIEILKANGYPEEAKSLATTFTQVIDRKFSTTARSAP